MPISFKSFKMDGSPIEVSVRSVIAIMTAITLTIGAITGGLEWQQYKEISLIVFTYYFTVKINEDKQKRERTDGKEVE